MAIGTENNKSRKLALFIGTGTPLVGRKGCSIVKTSSKLMVGATEMQVGKRRTSQFILLCFVQNGGSRERDEETGEPPIIIPSINVAFSLILKGGVHEGSSTRFYGFQPSCRT